jgi:hypothetical protein
MKGTLDLLEVKRGTMDLLQEAQRLSPRLTQWLQAIGEQPFVFVGEHPLDHSRHNHVHLWLLEYEADAHPQITLAFRCRIVSFIFEVWKQRLKGYRPYQEAGFRLYLYEDSAPTVSVVAETPYGFPYGGQPVFVHSPAEIMERYVGSSWRERFQTASGRDTEPEQLLEAIVQQNGSIGRSTANSLHMTRAELRQRIEWFDLQEAVNRVRKKHGRPPAQFLDPDELQEAQRYRIYELKLPARH